MEPAAADEAEAEVEEEEAKEEAKEEEETAKQEEEEVLHDFSGASKGASQENHRGRGVHCPKHGQGITSNEMATARDFILPPPPLKKVTGRKFYWQRPSRLVDPFSPPPPPKKKT